VCPAIDEVAQHMIDLDRRGLAQIAICTHK